MGATSRSVIMCECRLRCASQDSHQVSRPGAGEHWVTVRSSRSDLTCTYQRCCFPQITHMSESIAFCIRIELIQSVTYHRFLRFYPDGTVISFLTTDQ